MEGDERQLGKERRDKWERGGGTSGKGEEG